MIQGLMEKLLLTVDDNDKGPSDVQTLTSEILSLAEDEGAPQRPTSMSMLDSSPIPLSGLIKCRIQQMHCRALISMSKFRDAITFCDSLGLQEEREFLILEKSYAQYKLGWYANCRDNILNTTKTMDDDNSNSNSITLSDDCIRGLAHILAQCHYHLHDVERASQLYSDMVTGAGIAAGKASNDYDEDSEIVANAFALAIANNSHSIPSSLVGTFEQYFHDQLDSADANADAEVEYPYEMVYNYATNLLLTSTNLTQTKQALELLNNVKEECENAYNESDNDNENENTDLFKEIMPIQSNIALARFLCGDLNGATRAYLELTMSSKRMQEKDPSFNGGGAILATENNLAVLNHIRGSSHSVYDLLKSLPDISNSSLSTTTAKANPHQIRIILYNRAVLYHKCGKNPEARTAIKALRASLSPEAKVKHADSSKKKKRKNASGNFVASPACEADKTLWECRIRVLEHECGVIMANSNGACLDSMQSSIQNSLNKGMGDLNGYDEGTLEYAVAELQLYQAEKAIQDADKFDEAAKLQLIASLEELPKSIRNSPATIATLCSLYRSLGLNEKVEMTLNSSAESGMAQKSVADFKLRLGMYDEAAAIYDSLINGNTSSLGEEEINECAAGLVKALSHIDTAKAIDLVSDLIMDDVIDIPDGEDLEAMEIPRLHKGSGTGSGQGRKIIRSRENGR